MLVPSDFMLQHEHALQALNLSINFRGSATNRNSNGGASYKDSNVERQQSEQGPQNSNITNYIDFSKSNEQYGNYFNNNDTEEAAVSSPGSEEQTKSKSFEPVQLRFNSDSLIKVSEAMEKANGPLGNAKSFNNPASSSN